MFHPRFSWLGGLTLVVLGVAFLMASDGGSETSPAPDAVTIPSYAGLPLSFEVNQGQADAQVEYLARGSGYKLLLSSYEAVLTLRAPLGDETAGTVQQHTLRIGFAGATTPARVEALDELPGKVNYLVGNDPEGWRTNIPTYAAIVYRDLYPGVDLVVRGDRRRPEFVFVVAPGADPESIELELGGTEGIDLDADGNLLLGTRNGPIRQDRPLAYQIIEGEKQEISGGYLLLGGARIGYTVGSYDSEAPLFIGVPLISSGSLREGIKNHEEGAFKIAMDARGNTYLSGRILVDNPGVNKPTRPSGEETEPVKPRTRRGHYYARDPRAPTNAPLPLDLGDAFVAKLSPDGSELLYSTYFGARGDDVPMDIAVDSDGNVVVTGWTTSRGFPTISALQPEFGGVSDAFVAKLTSDGSGFLFSTFIGGARDDFGNAIALDGAEDVWLTGETGGFYVTPDAVQVDRGGLSDAFLVKLTADGSTLLYADHLGGDGADVGNGIAVGLDGNVYVTGSTSSSNFPLENALQEAFGGSGPSGAGDAFVARFDAESLTYVYSTYLGGSSDDVGSSIVVDAMGNAYVTGRTGAADFPTTPLVVQPSFGSESPDLDDAFVVKVAPDGLTLEYSTYLGGAGRDVAADIVVDAEGHAWVTGTTGSHDFPTENPEQPNLGGQTDAFAARLSPSGDLLLGSTYLGGEKDDTGSGIVLDLEERGAIITGLTRSAIPPLVLEPASRIGDAFVARIDTLVAPTGMIGCPSMDINFDGGPAETGTAWNLAENWDTDLPPTAAQDVCIDGFDVTITGAQNGLCPESRGICLA